MGELKFAKKVPQTDVNCILKDFAEHYVDKEKLRKYGLMWNSFARKPKCISMEEIRDIPIPPEDMVFFMMRETRPYMLQGWKKLSLIF